MQATTGDKNKLSLLTEWMGEATFRFNNKLPGV